MSIHVLDTQQLGRRGIVAVTALETAEGIVIFDTGPESTFNNIVAELEKVGLQVSDVGHVFLSHIHFDHAGAAWRFATLKNQSGKGPTVYVHPKGAAHLIDPTKLVRSATRIFGDDMERLWGTIAPVPEERVRVLQDGEIVNVPPYQIRAIATPGHATHHHVYHWGDNVFGGDVAGVRIGKGPPIPPFVPPELDVEAWLESLGKIRELPASNLYLPHFGRVEGPLGDHFASVEERVIRWAEWFRQKLRSGTTEAQLVPEFAALEHFELAEGGADESEIAGYEAADPSSMAIPAAIRYWQKFHPEQLGAEAPLA